MKQFKTKLVLFATVIFIGLLPGKVYSQLDEMGKILTGGVSDAEKIAEAYLSPFTNAFGATLNSGWFNTARPHRFPGFDLTFSANLAFIPENAELINLSGLDLKGVYDLESTPTIAGGTVVNPATLAYDLEGAGTVEYTLPQGMGLGIIPAPTLQLGIGLPFGTDIIGRYIPQVALGDVGNLGLWGIGVKHSLKQWIPVVQRLPVVNLSVMAGYTKFYTNAGLDFRPADINATDNTTMAVSFDDQQLEFGVGSFTANLIASADIPFITGYLALGFNSTNSNLKMTGWYPVPDLDQTTPVVTDNSALKDPIDIKLKGDTGGLQPRLTAGAKLKLAVLHIHADYTYSNYSVVSAGIGISFR